MFWQLVNTKPNSCKKSSPKLHKHQDAIMYFLKFSTLKNKTKQKGESYDYAMYFINLYLKCWLLGNSVRSTACDSYPCGLEEDFQNIFFFPPLLGDDPDTKINIYYNFLHLPRNR